MILKIILTVNLKVKSGSKLQQKTHKIGTFQFKTKIVLRNKTLRF